MVTFISSCLDVGVAFVLQFIIDASTEENIENLIRVGTGCLLFMIMFAVVKYINTIAVRKCIRNILIQLKHDVFMEFISNSAKSFRSKNIAEYISNITNDTNIIEREYLESIFSLLTIIYNFILGCISITFLNRSLALISIGVGLFALIVPILLGKKLTILKEEYSKKLAVFTIKIKDMLSGVEIIKSYNLEKRITSEFDDSNIGVEESKYRTYKFNAYLSAMSSSVNYFTICLILVIVGIQVIQGNLTIGAAIAAMQLLDYIISPINTIGVYINKIKSNAFIINKLTSVDMLKKQIGEDVINDFYDRISLNNVTYSYDGKHNAVEKINFDFEKNKKYVIIGTSGGGKSTLLQLISGGLEEIQGSITIDGKEMNTIDPQSLNKLMAIIYQNVFLFDDTIKNNITLFDEGVGEEDIENVIKTVGLERLINTKSLDGKVGENGEFLSGGEKQRIAIARALIKNTKIILFDEATSALDTENAFNIENMLLNIPDLTLIVVTHKLIIKNLKKYDSILAMQDGKLKEYGSFDDLMEQKGYFYSLLSIMHGGDNNEQDMDYR